VRSCEWTVTSSTTSVSSADIPHKADCLQDDAVDASLDYKFTNFYANSLNNSQIYYTNVNRLQ